LISSVTTGAREYGGSSRRCRPNARPPLRCVHDAADHHALAVADRVHVDLGGVGEEAVHQHRMFGRSIHRDAHVFAQRADLVDDHHRTPAEHVRRPHEHRIADPLGDPFGFVRGCARCRTAAARGPAFRAPLRSARGPRRGRSRRAACRDRHARTLERHREAQRRLSAELHDHAERLLARDDLQPSSSVSGSK